MTDMGAFNKAMDELIVTGNLIDATMTKNSADENASTAVENMLNQMKTELVQETAAHLGPTAVIQKPLAQPVQAQSNLNMGTRLTLTSPTCARGLRRAIEETVRLQEYFLSWLLDQFLIQAPGTNCINRS
jgi:hypothetical protein